GVPGLRAVPAHDRGGERRLRDAAARSRPAGDRGPGAPAARAGAAGRLRAAPSEPAQRGGEQQRVALARALATEPEVLLLDEPLSNLDAKLRQELRLELKALLRSVGTTTIVVTHDQEEAITLSEHVIIVNRGRTEQAGPPDEVYERPRNRFVAEFMGRTNWFSGRLTRAAGPGLWWFESEGKTPFMVAPDAGREGLTVQVAVRPERMGVQPAGEATPGTGLNHLAGRIAVGEYLGAEL